MSSIGNEDYVLVRRSEVKATEIKAASASSSTSSASSSSAVVLKVAAVSSAPSSDAKSEPEMHPRVLSMLKTPLGFGKVGKALEIKCNQNFIVTLPFNSSTPYTLEMNVTNLGEWSSLALLFEQYRVKKICVELDTHGMTSTYLAQLSTTSSTMTGVSMAHALMSTYLSPTGMSYDNLLDIQNSKFIDYGRSKNIFKISCKPMCFYTGSAPVLSGETWQATSIGGSARWGCYYLSKQSGIMTQDVLMFGRVIFCIEFRNRR